MNPDKVLCSYGLWGMVRGPKIEEVLSQVPCDPSQAAEMVIRLHWHGGKDNVSVFVVSTGEAQS